MIRYVVVFLLSSHSTNAASSFTTDIVQIKDHLRNEIPSFICKIFSSVERERERTICDTLSNSEKQSICDKIMRHLIDEKHGSGVFQSFGSELPPPPLFVGSGDPNKCEERLIDELNSWKPMLWCRSRLFRQKQSDENGTEEGFFCAGSRKTDGRVFVFRQSVVDRRKMSPVGQLDNVHEILQYVYYQGGFSYPITWTQFIA